MNRTAEELIDDLVQILGPDWLAAQLAAMPRRQVTKRVQAIQQLKAHDFVEFYSRYAIRSAPRQASDHEIVRYAHIADHVVGASRVKGFEQIVSSLRSRGRFLDTITEAIVADSYGRRGARVEFVPPAPNRRTPDLHAWPLPTGPLSIECKRIRARSTVLHRARQRYDDIINRVLSALPARLPPLVYVRFADIPEEQVVATAIGALRNVRAPTAWSCVHSDSTVAVWIGPNPGGGAANVGWNLPAIADLDRVYAQAMVEINDGRFGEPAFVALETDGPKFTIHDFEGAFKGAVGQLPESGPGVVAIQIPQPRAEDLDAYLGWARRVFDAGRFRRVNTLNVLWLQENHIEQPADGHTLRGVAYSTMWRSVTHGAARSPI